MIKQVIFCVLVLLCFSTQADDHNKHLLTLGTPFADNMVMQHQSKAAIWGKAQALSTIKVQGSWGQSSSTTADENGKWQLSLQTPKAGGPHKLVISSTHEEQSHSVTIANVLIGEVWLASGQSNMERSLKGTDDLDSTLASLNCNNIRLFTLERNPKQDRQNSAPAKWELCNQDTAPHFSAVGLHFAQRLNADLNVPIGILHSSFGGTRINPWTPIEAFTGEALLQAKAKAKKTDDDHQRLLSEQSDERSIKFNLNKGPGYLYNGMIHPLVPYTLQGFIWYQGESNRSDGKHYGLKFKRMIKAWRNVWRENSEQNAALPFYFVQIAPYGYADNPDRKVDTPLLLPILRDAQSQALSLPHTGMAVITDFGDAKDIHPREKRAVGERLALLALNQTYQQDIVAHSPTFKDMRVIGNAIEIEFTDAEGLKSRDKSPLTWFEIAGQNEQFYPAKARIKDNRVLVSNEAVSKPVAVRFAYHELADPNLVNGAGLPAVAFRTDNWEIADLPDTAK